LKFSSGGFAPQQKGIVDAALFAARCFALIQVKLSLAQAAEHFAPSPGLSEVSLLFVAQLLHARQFDVEFSALAVQSQFRGAFKFQFCAGCTGLKFAGLLYPVLLFLHIQLLDGITHTENLLVGGSQTQFLLVFEALIQMQHGLEGKMKGHTTWESSARES
jgi:hypothetical protein